MYYLLYEWGEKLNYIELFTVIEVTYFQLYLSVDIIKVD